MEETAQINLFNKGMNTDTHQMFMPEGSYSYAENIRLLADDSNSTGCIQNIDSAKKYNITYATNIAKEDYFKFDEVVGTAVSNDVMYVVTARKKENKTYNMIWKITGFESVDVTASIILKGYLNISGNPSIVINNESEKVVTMYITNESGSILAIPLLQKYDEEITDPLFFDIVPRFNAKAPEILGLVEGKLPAGLMLYCYLVFKTNGIASATSMLSSKIAIVPDVDVSKDMLGYEKNKLSNRGCKIQIEFENIGLQDTIRIYGIRYLSNIDVPKIYVINEFKIPPTNDIVKIEYVDDGSNFLNEITLEEFNDLVPFDFTTKTLETTNNRLFAANIGEKEFDVDFDARAYRCNSNGIVKIENSAKDQIEAPIEDIINGTVVIPKEHDCINPMNEIVEYPTYDEEREYAFYKASGVNERFYGGAGPNVSYQFVVLKFKETYDGNNFGLNPGFDMYIEKVPASTVLIFNNSYATFPLWGPIPDNKRMVIPNYTDSTFSQLFLSYLRDEVYRFGIVFYNEKMTPSPVHWIGDIRFPASSVEEYKPFDLKGLERGVKEIDRYMNSFPIGIRFTINNIPEDAKKFEIVRCDRTEKDRTVVTTGMLGKTRDVVKGPDYDFKTPVKMPTLIPSFGKYFTELTKEKADYLFNVAAKDYTLDTGGYFTFISADLCFNKEKELVKSNMYIVPEYCAMSIYSDDHVVSGRDADNTEEPKSFGILNEVSVNSEISTFKPLNIDVSVNYNLTVDPNGKQGYTYMIGCMKPFYYRSKKYATQTGDGSGPNAEGIATNRAYPIEEVLLATNLDPTNVPFLGDNIDYIGGTRYKNTPSSEFLCTYGIGGVMNILHAPKMYSGLNGTYYKGVEFSGGLEDRLKALYYTLFCTIKKKAAQYGGNTYSSRLNSVYVGIGASYIHDTMSDSVYCFGGDTYLGILDYQYSLAAEECTEQYRPYHQRRIVLAYIPLESSVNVYYRNDDHLQRTASASGAFQSKWKTEPGVINGISITKPMYSYNAAYSNTNNVKKFVSKNPYDINKNYKNRIICSEQKSIGELNDSWSKFRFANYLDVDNNYGGITNLKTFNDRLYFFQPNAVGIASVNERSLITDSNNSQLVLGTGTVLGRYDYIVVGNGDSVFNDKSIVNSLSTMYWYDLDKNVICCLNNTFIELSKVKAIQQYMNSIPFESRNNAVSLYDNKYNEVWFNINNKSLVFNELLNLFSSVYTHAPQHVVNFSKVTVTMKNNELYYINNYYKVANQNDEDNTSKILFFVNKDYIQTKVFDNISFDADFYNPEGDELQVIKEISFSTKKLKAQTLNGSNVENREDNYRLPISRELRDNIDSKSNNDRMRGKYLVCDYTFDCNNGKQFKIPYIKTTYRYSMI